MRQIGIISLVAVAALLLGEGAQALTIRDIQYSTPPDYVSPYLGQVVDVSGGVVLKVFVGGSTKIAIQDPALGDEWAGVQLVFSDPSQAAGITRGDQIDIFGGTVAEYRGNTQITMAATSTFVINSSGNVVDPVVVSVAEIPSPVNHDLSEKYEFMLLKVEEVTVGAMDLGKNSDDYELTNAEGTCWGSDYANEDLLPGNTYYVEPGQSFHSITGYLEQYLRLEQGWDYYQLLPRDADDYDPVSTPVAATTWGEVKALFR
jgi:predicted extracellular nuclease